MNNLCCELNAEFICKCCGGKWCHACYAEEKDFCKILDHEKEGRCSAGANVWLNRNGDSEGLVIFGKL